MKQLAQLPTARQMGFARFVNQFIVGNSGLNFKLPTEAMNQLGFELGARTTELREPNAGQRNEAQRAIDTLTEAADQPDNQVGLRAFTASVANGAAGRVTSSSGQQAWVKSSPKWAP